ncbi:MAG: sigma-70 family RNA polymerase sigma factor, partial [Planctomycetota bacterium]
EAWGELVELYGPLIAHWCYRCGLDSNQASDIVQEVFVALSRSIGTYKPSNRSGAFRAWLWTVSSNKIRDFFRGQQAVLARGGSTALADLQTLPAEANVPEEEPTDAEQVHLLLERGLEQVRAEFEPRSWEIFERSVLDQIATALVAEEFEVSAAAVRQTRSRILRRLRQQLGDLDVG